MVTVFSTSSDRDRITRLYDSNGNLLAEYPGYDAQFTPDQRHLVVKSATSDLLEVWPIDNGLDDLLARGCHWLRHYFVNYPEKKPDVCNILGLEAK